MTENEKYLHQNRSYLVMEIEAIYELANAGLLHTLNGVRISREDNTRYVYYVDRTPETSKVLRAYWSAHPHKK